MTVNRSPYMIVAVVLSLLSQWLFAQAGVVTEQDVERYYEQKIAEIKACNGDMDCINRVKANQRQRQQSSIDWLQSEGKYTKRTISPAENANGVSNKAFEASAGGDDTEQSLSQNTIGSTGAGHSKAQHQAFIVQIRQFLTGGLGDLARSGKLVGRGSESFADKPSYMFYQLGLEFALSEGGSPQTFQVGFHQFDTVAGSQRFAAGLVDTLSAPLQVSQFAQVNQLLPGHGRLSIGDTDYYRGTHKKTRPNSTVSIEEHTAIAQHKTWLVKVSATTGKVNRNKEIRETEIDLLNRLVQEFRKSNP